MKASTVARYAAAVFGTLALLFLLWVFRQAVVLFIFSLAFAAAARPSVESLTRRGMKRTIALLLVYISFIGLLLVLLYFLGGALLKELQQLSDGLARTYDRMWIEWPDGNDIQQAIIQQLPPPQEFYQSFSPEQRSLALQTLLGITLGGANFFAQIATITILSIYWSIDQVHFERLWLSLLPVESRARYRNIWRSIEHDFGTYMRSELMQSILAGLLLGIGLWAMGVNYPILLAFISALAWLIPWLGGVLVVLVIGLVAFSQSIGLGILATAYSIGVLFFLEFYVEPRFNRSGQFSSIFSILLIIALVEPFGLLGFIVAPPLAAAIELIFRYNLQSRPVTVAVETSQRITELRDRIRSIRETADAGDEPLEPQTQNMLDRVEEMVDRADELLENEKPASPSPEANRAQV